MIVIDASAVVEYVLQSEKGVRVFDRIHGQHRDGGRGAERVTLHCPELTYLEVPQALRKLVILGELTVREADRALRDFLDLRITYYAHRILVPRTWQLRENLTSYDAAYVALCEALDASLLTFDQRLARTADALVTVEFV